MIEYARRRRGMGFLLVAFCLTSTTAAYAECAWALWSHNDFRIEGVPEVTQDRWTVQDSASSLVQCLAKLEQLSTKAAGMRIVEQGETYKVWASPNLKPGVGQRVRLQCLPDTVDPRAPNTGDRTE
jgi:hypothetical protein